MELLLFILFLLGVICLGLAAFSVALTNRIAIGWFGLFLIGIVLLIERFPAL